MFILGGLAVHESDAAPFQAKIESFLTSRLAFLSLNAQRFELHATDIKNGNEEWAAVPLSDRISMLRGAYVTLTAFRPRDATFPAAFFGAVVDRRKVGTRRAREKLAYELVLNKFDAMLGRYARAGHSQSGLVIHDQKVVSGRKRAWTAERIIQEWTRDWREVAGRVGRLRHFADVPLFADAQASRLIQAADLVSFALWRAYGMNDMTVLNRMIEGFDHDGAIMHGLIHVSPTFAKATCRCPPCRNRLARGLDPAAP